MIEGFLFMFLFLFIFSLNKTHCFQYKYNKRWILNQSGSFSYSSPFLLNEEKTKPNLYNWKAICFSSNVCLSFSLLSSSFSTYIRMYIHMKRHPEIRLLYNYLFCGQRSPGILGTADNATEMQLKNNKKKTEIQVKQVYVCLIRIPIYYPRLCLRYNCANLQNKK